MRGLILFVVRFGLSASGKIINPDMVAISTSRGGVIQSFVIHLVTPFIAINKTGATHDINEVTLFEAHPVKHRLHRCYGE